MGLIDHKFEDNFITTSVDQVLNWARVSSVVAVENGWLLRH